MAWPGAGPGGAGRGAPQALLHTSLHPCPLPATDWLCTLGTLSLWRAPSEACSLPVHLGRSMGARQLLNQPAAICPARPGPCRRFCVLLGSGHRGLGALVVPDAEALEERAAQEGGCVDVVLGFLGMGSLHRAVWGRTGLATRAGKAAMGQTSSATSSHDTRPGTCAQAWPRWGRRRCGR